MRARAVRCADAELSGLSRFQPSAPQVELCTSLLLVGSARRSRHVAHMPIARHAVLASSFGLRFQGERHFVSAARTRSAQR
jgi:hypothetical protein